MELTYSCDIIFSITWRLALTTKYPLVVERLKILYSSFSGPIYRSGTRLDSDSGGTRLIRNLDPLVNFSAHLNEHTTLSLSLSLSCYVNTLETRTLASTITKYAVFFLFVALFRYFVATLAEAALLSTDSLWVIPPLEMSCPSRILAEEWSSLVESQPPPTSRECLWHLSCCHGTGDEKCA